MTEEYIKDAFLKTVEGKLSARSIDEFMPHVRVVHHPKKHVLIKEGQRMNGMYLLVSGAARSFYLSNGIEVNTWFALEDELVGSLSNFLGAPSRETIELIEDSILLAFDLQGIKKLMMQNLEIANLVNEAIAQHAIELEERLFDTHLRSAQERYETLLEEQSEVFQRVPLTYIASYLGISRETLSRLRAK